MGATRHSQVVRCINGLLDYLQVERKRVPGEVLAGAKRLECLLFAGYDPHLDGRRTVYSASAPESFAASSRLSGSGNTSRSFGRPAVRLARIRLGKSSVHPSRSNAGIFAEAKERGFNLKLLDIGGGFPAHYDDTVPPFRRLAKMINADLDRLFPEPIEILAEPGRFLVASAATAVAKIIGKAVRGGKLCYYIDDGVYHTYSGIIFDHAQYHLKSFRKGPTQICSVFGPTCDALDTISLAEQLPDMEIGEYVCSENIGAYSAASSTHFNGFAPAKVIHINQ